MGWGEGLCAWGTGAWGSLVLALSGELVPPVTAPGWGLSRLQHTPEWVSLGALIALGLWARSPIHRGTPAGH